METFRIRIIHANGEILVRDYAFSQTVALLKEATEDQKAMFWSRIDKPMANLHESIILPNGDDLWLVKQV